MINKILSIPVVFQLQQRLCNSYQNVRDYYKSALASGPLNILETGCSTGAAGQVIFDMRRDTYTGIDITSSMKETRRVLKKSGRLFVSEPVFTANKLMSNILLSLDRGKYIRESAEYTQLLEGFDISRIDFFKFSAHRFIGGEASPEKQYLDGEQSQVRKTVAELC